MGTVALTGTSTYTGTTNVIGGTLQIGTLINKGAMTTGQINVQNGGTLAVYNSATAIFANNISNGSTGVGTVETDFNNVTFSGALTDGAAGQLAFNGTLGNTVTFTNANNTYTGSTTISQSTLQIGTTSLAGSIGANSAVNIQGSGTLNLVNVAGGTLANNIAGSNGAGTLTISSTQTLTLSGAISDAGGGHALKLNQSGTGKTILTGLDSYSKGTAVTAGTLQIGNGSTGNLTGAGAVTLSNSATLILDQADGASMTVAEYRPRVRRAIPLLPSRWDT